MLRRDAMRADGKGRFVEIRGDDDNSRGVRFVLGDVGQYNRADLLLNVDPGYEEVFA